MTPVRLEAVVASTIDQDLVGSTWAVPKRKKKHCAVASLQSTSGADASTQAWRNAEEAPYQFHQMIPELLHL